MVLMHFFFAIFLFFSSTFIWYDERIFFCSGGTKCHFLSSKRPKQLMTRLLNVKQKDTSVFVSTFFNFFFCAARESFVYCCFFSGAFSFSLSFSRFCCCCCIFFSFLSGGLSFEWRCGTRTEKTKAYG